MIEINELTKYYGERRAVGPLSFAIEQGEVVGLLGLNGAGKTTTLRMLSSDLLPTSGSLRVDGVDLVEQPEKVRPNIGYLPDRPPVYGEMRVREYLVFAARLRGMKRATIGPRVQQVIDTTALGDVAEDRIDTLSHGFKQRVGIAQAIVHQPKLLLLDEPISGLDPVQIVEMRELIRSLRGEHTLVLSSHILSEISETCDRLLVILHGEIIASGTEAELSQHMTSHAYSVSVEMAPRDDAQQAAQRVVSSVAGVTEALAGASDERIAGADTVTVEFSGDDDVRAAVCKALIDADMGILELRRSAKELEALFLRLTGKA
ncbi:MAG TPA: ABC transporter ATP-binding protein [Sorangium sp.]|nr:ABC transporter ATP-binding protein [Sorangium sp.]